MIKISVRGSFNRTMNFLENAKPKNLESILNRYGREGVNALSLATPKDSSETSKSWSYKITSSSKGYELSWYNSNVNDGVPIAIILQYGHGTGTGGYVEGRDYINPALRPIFDKISNSILKEVR